MAIQIINCPSCGTFLLEDTAECHACGHILNAHRAATTKRRSLPTDHAVDQDMDVCANCGESCRKGLVRCWNCGSFTRAEIEEAYRQRADTGAAELDNRFDLPVLDATSVTESDSMTRRASTPESLIDAPPMAREEHDGSDDFELSEEIQLSEADESSFDLSDQIQLRSEDDEFDAPPVFSLQPAEPAAPAQSIPFVHSGAPLGLAGSAETIPPVSKPASPSVPDETAAIPLLGSTDASADAGGIPSLDAGSPAVASKGGSPAALSPEDELLKIAADEEAEISSMRKGLRTKDTFVVYCPQGHRIRVRERFRGKTGKCPKCASVFIVPAKQAPRPKKLTDVEFATVGGDEGKIVGRYARWLTDVRLHNVLPEKLKLVADSLVNDYQSVDVGFANDEILVVVLVAAGGLFGGAAKKKPAARTAMIEYFSKPDANPEGVTAAAKKVVAKDGFSQINLVQPAPAGTESLFASIPIFGTGRIAIRLPKKADEKQTQYLSFSLSEFRVFAYAMRSVCGIEEFGANADVPMTDQYDTFKCHYNDTPVLSLRNIEYYLKDAILKPEVTGWQCSTCGLIVSEDGRKKEKIGGLNGKGIAKAPCPKCKQKFGNNPMYKIPEAPAATPAASAENPTNAAAAETPTTTGS